MRRRQFLSLADSSAGDLFIKVSSLGVTQNWIRLLMCANVFAASVIYKLPFGPSELFLNNLRGIGNHLVGGWGVASISDTQTGHLVLQRARTATTTAMLAIESWSSDPYSIEAGT